MQEKASPAALFDALASDYETMREEIGWSPYPHVIHAFGEGPFEGQKFLDLGCGTGEISRFLHERGGEPLGLDISLEMCMQAADRSPGLPFLPFDMSDPLPFEDGCYDGVIALGCLEYLEDLPATVAEIHRVLKPGGIFLGVIERCGEDCPGGVQKVVDFFDEWQRFRMTEREVMEMASPLFADVQLDRVLGYILEETNERIQYIRIVARR